MRRNPVGHPRLKQTRAYWLIEFIYHKEGPVARKISPGADFIKPEAACLNKKQ